jgi:hypothetical protein
MIRRDTVSRSCVQDWERNLQVDSEILPAEPHGSGFRISLYQGYSHRPIVEIIPDGSGLYLARERGRIRPASFFGRERSIRPQILKIGQRLHTLEEDQRAGRPGPDIGARQALVAKDREELLRLQAERNAIDAQVFDWEQKLRHQHAESMRNDPDVSRYGAELRAHLRTLDDNARPCMPHWSPPHTFPAFRS